MTTDADLMRSISDDDERAFSELFHRYSSRIYAKSYAYIQDQEVCEQIVHDVFLTIWTNRKTLQIASFIGYLTAAARYRVYKHIAALKANPIVYKDDVADLSVQYSKNEGDTQLASYDLEQQLHAYLQILPKKCREIFVLSRIQILSNDEIAEKLGINKRTVENQLTRALKHLRISFKHLIALFIVYYL
ncbi:RNA polymerase sigma-70 factor [Pedobacter metabolipauper]|uniref:RNA polymerase sigma-70 factor (ECF subfamily) n=1 Tax=Pedobacter metabolipauper TaxID=425513 RepID=A0A4R6SZ12_9SPHI|nr:RNA polymerase sigma-70 factor [Pedobacter metabolipauper]TDQ11292.1 RNA polymerase sigma-70 factor (ECF subfamily) [Pedobacter metabolipauper]